MIFVIIWFICALVSFWLWLHTAYNDSDYIIIMHDFVAMIILCIVAAPLALVGVLMHIGFDYVDKVGNEEVHFFDRLFKKGDKDDKL